MMTEILTAAQMRAVEKAAIESGGASGSELMERAGEGVIRAILSKWPELAEWPGSALVLCGPGNNGGDGFVIARLLHERAWTVEVLFHGEAARLPPDARANHDRWRRLGPLRPMAEGPQGTPDLVIDAVFGIGLRAAPPPEVRMTLAIPWRRELVRRVAVEVPSHLCADSGRALCDGLEEPQDLTVTFHRPKPGHFLSEGPELCGALVVADIGLPDLHDADALPLDLEVFTPEEGWFFEKHSGHKFDHGHALVLAGGPGRGGAARLAARAALRIGAGLVTVAPPPEAMTENAARLDAVMLQPLADREALAALLADRRISVLCLGPAFGTGAREAELVAEALHARRATLLDADALTLIARDPALFTGLHPACVLTPHGGEFARLFPDLAQRLAEPPVQGPAWSRLDAVREAAARAGCTVLLKGADTVIAAPDGSARIHCAARERGAPWLATAGAGDVLSGIITGLLARGRPPLEAASAGAWLHVEAARSFGPGLIAEDLPDQLPKVLRGLGL